MAEIRVGDRVRVARYVPDCKFWSEWHSDRIGQCFTVMGVDDVGDIRVGADETDYFPPGALDVIESSPRRIALTLAKDTTATECGKCPCLSTTAGLFLRCQAFQRALTCSTNRALRLAQCIAAEVTP